MCPGILILCKSFIDMVIVKFTFCQELGITNRLSFSLQQDKNNVPYFDAHNELMHTLVVWSIIYLCSSKF